MSISFEVNGEVIEFASSNVLDGYYDYLLEQQIAGQIEGVISFVDNLLKQEKLKSEVLREAYLDQAKQARDAGNMSTAEELAQLAAGWPPCIKRDMWTHFVVF